MCYSAIVKRDIHHLEKRFSAIAVGPRENEYELISKVKSKEFPPLQARIFPGHFAPVVYQGFDGKKSVELMRYGTYPPFDVGMITKYTSFNARSDNLRSHFWSNAFMHHHGFVILEGFYEWVAVKDLINAGSVSLSAVEEEFSRQRETRKAKILAEGKAYRPTPAERRPPLERQIIIKFTPQDGRELIVPVIFSRKNSQSPADGLDAGFAIVTDEPPVDIRAAGHDRCPVIFVPGAERQWMTVEGKRALNFEELIVQKQRVSFIHGLEVAGF